jgi:hypothetical protein
VLLYAPALIAVSASAFKMILVRKILSALNKQTKLLIESDVMYVNGTELGHTCFVREKPI